MAIETWEAVLLGVLVLLLLLWFGPGVRQAVKNTRRASAQEWLGVLVPVGLVALFVMLLIAMVR
ncbi:MAG: hypothetical protein GWN84_20400 [Gammaproteobacteria bacterium]|nr:hypothetical protein [Gammaproteobacteria bacterium]NIR85123.1 hypothetical protein [Gammaproteobacteria bacterium]NIR92052.1 hypothetical protein [Gammaproteobacteria bacterium]NIU06172.1 hypothetical protein [Gammaproteobacteria bacterium]NIV53171.1 hypothetical protein [Gammaproteobacteria bacterium]